MSVVLVDAGGSNLGSVHAALGRLGVDAPVTGDPAQIRNATHVILPGVGAAAVAMARLQAQGLVTLIRELRQPVLGVCVGMQILYEHSEEGDALGLGVLPGRVRRLQGGPGLRVPHMGWNDLQVHDRPHPLLPGLVDQYAYFVHSFAAPVSDNTLLSCEHGERFTAMAANGNFHGAQFHPERSAATGARLLQNFLELTGGDAA